MSFLSRVKEIISPADYSDEVNDEENEVDEEEEEDSGLIHTEYQNEERSTVAAPKTVSYNSSLDLKIVRPESYTGAKEIAGYLISGKTVVLNFENTNKEDARRLFDFLSGAACALGGEVSKVSNHTCIITPSKNINVSGEQLKSVDEEIAETGSNLF